MRQILPVPASRPSRIAEVLYRLTNYTIHRAVQMIMRMFEDTEGDDFFDEPRTEPGEPNQAYIGIGEPHSNLPTPHLTRRGGDSNAETRDDENHAVRESTSGQFP